MFSESLILSFHFFCVEGFTRVKLYLDAWIRQHLSTSPDVEKEDFAHGTKEALKCILTHPNPLKSKFIGERALRYERKPDGFWELKSNGPGSSK